MNQPLIERPADGSSYGIAMEIERIGQLIAKGRRLIGEGRTLDLSSIEARVVALVDTLKWIPNEHGRRLKNRLTQLLADLEQLETDVRSQFRPVAARIGALQAYRTRRD